METSNSIEIQFYFIIHLLAFYWNTPYQAHVQNDCFYTKKAVTVAELCYSYDNCVMFERHTRSEDAVPEE